jgi:7-cyano-7-deazaguanine synthase in queuosine biosynthesis
MKSKLRIELPERGPDEPDMTDSQRQYIHHLLQEIEGEQLSLDVDSFGKWQASSLIDRLQEICKGKSSERTTSEGIRRPSYG